MMTECNIIVTSERLYVRYLNFSDHESLFNIYSDKEAMKFRSSAAFEHLEDAKKMIEKTFEQIENKKEYRFGIIEKETNELIGTFLYKVIDKIKCEVGYSIGRKHWKLGYGFEILRAMLHYLEEIGFKYVIATTKKENIASIKLLIKAGFTQSINETNKELNLFRKDLE